MPLANIRIQRSYNIINGYVILPNNLLGNETSIAVADLLSIWPSATTARLTGAHGDSILQQQWIEFPETVECCGSNDVVEAVKSHYDTDVPTSPRGWPPGERPPDSPDPDPDRPDYPGAPCDLIHCEELSGAYLSVMWSPGIDSECCKGRISSSAYLYPNSDTECIWTTYIDQYQEQQYGFITIVIQLINNNGYCYYLMTIYCNDTGDLIYSGYLTPVTSDNPYIASYMPVGTYTQTGGCDTLTVMVDVIWPNY